ncbi:MAG: hypothetical protein M3O25_04985 [Actinomycetota bacterium]|nr:hypothetical protein [Actinomycetota bacterium]
MPASLELVKIAVQAYGDRYCEIALGLADPLIRWDERASRPDGELVWKRDDVQKAMRAYLDGWQEYAFELEDIAEVTPGKVVGICREHGIDARDLPVDRRFGGLWVVEEAKIVSWSTYLTPREAVKAARELGASSSRFREGPSVAHAQRAPSRKGRGARLTQSPRKPPVEDDEKRRAAKARARLRRQRGEAARS